MNQSIENLRALMLNSTQYTTNQVYNLVRDAQIEQLNALQDQKVKDAIIRHEYLRAIGNQFSFSESLHLIGADCRNFVEQTIN